MSRILNLENSVELEQEKATTVTGFDIDLELGKAELKDSEQNREQRKGFANKLFWLLAIFIGITLFIIFLVGVGFLDLDSAVLITMLSTMSANVIGIFIYVVKYLFNRPNICSNCGVRITQNQTIKT